MSEQTTLAAEVLDICREARLTLATAESCTGGLVVAALTKIAGSSDVVECGFVTYADQAKKDLLGIPAALITAHGSVSDPVARAMAEGALAHSAADVAVGITGIAGPGGATSGKPVGLVHLAAARRGHQTLHERHVFTGDRALVRLCAVISALKLLKQLASQGEP
jgi:nicotinamide-nucleotide amidase